MATARRAAWWTSETDLQPEDWVIGLGLSPGEIHRHLLNRCMARLQKAGTEAIPALSDALTSADPEVVDIPNSVSDTNSESELISTSPSANDSKTVYVIPIREDIMPPLTYLVRRGIKEAIVL